MPWWKRIVASQRPGRLRVSKGVTATTATKAMIANATTIQTRMRGLTVSSPHSGESVVPSGPHVESHDRWQTSDHKGERPAVLLSQGQ
jgi:hypothetical protein